VDEINQNHEKFKCFYDNLDQSLQDYYENFKSINESCKAIVISYSDALTTLIHNDNLKQGEFTKEEKAIRTEIIVRFTSNLNELDEKTKTYFMNKLRIELKTLKKTFQTNHDEIMQKEYTGLLIKRAIDNYNKYMQEMLPHIKNIEFMHINIKTRVMDEFSRDCPCLNEQLVKECLVQLDNQVKLIYQEIKNNIEMEEHNMTKIKVLYELYTIFMTKFIEKLSFISPRWLTCNTCNQF